MPSAKECPKKTLFIALGFFIASFCLDSAGAQLKMTVGQAGVNPGTSLYFIAQRENLFAKHGLEVNVIATTTTAAVQGMLGGSLHLTLGAGRRLSLLRWKGRRLSQ